MSELTKMTDELTKMKKLIEAKNPILIILSDKFYYFILGHYDNTDNYEDPLNFWGIPVRRSRDCDLWELWSESNAATNQGRRR